MFRNNVDKVDFFHKNPKLPFYTKLKKNIVYLIIFFHTLHKSTSLIPNNHPNISSKIKYSFKKS